MERYKATIKPHTYSAFGSSIKISRPGSKTSSTGRKSSVGSSKPPRATNSKNNSLTPKVEQRGKGLYYVTNAIQLQLENKPKTKKGPVISRNHKKIYEKSESPPKRIL
jgi:hypothetical protein